MVLDDPSFMSRSTGFFFSDPSGKGRWVWELKVDPPLGGAEILLQSSGDGRFTCLIL